MNTLTFFVRTLSVLVAGLIIAFAAQGVSPAHACGDEAPEQTKTPADAPAQAVLAVEGMTCDGCAGQLEGVLVKLDGVVAAVVSYDSASATIGYDPAKTTPSALIAAIEKAGYKAKVSKGEAKRST